MEYGTQWRGFFLPQLRCRNILAGAAVILFSAFVVSPLLALNPHKSINQYGHRIWLTENGLPSNAVNAVLQTHVGYLWLGTPSGLFRSDGVEFQTVSTSTETDMSLLSISTLYETRDSTLWIGTFYSGLRSLKDGILTVYDLKHGFHDTQVRSIYQSRKGNLWIGTPGGLFLLHNDSLVPVPLNPNYISGIAEDARGRV